MSINSVTAKFPEYESELMMDLLYQFYRPNNTNRSHFANWDKHYKCFVAVYDACTSISVINTSHPKPAAPSRTNVYAVETFVDPKDNKSKQRMVNAGFRDAMQDLHDKLKSYQTPFYEWTSTFNSLVSNIELSQL